jgi:2-hydroxy-6-oxonona-2,4-dienedioate hydrolase
MGAAISIQMYGLQPDRVNKIALLNAATLRREVPLPFKLMCFPLLGGLMAQPNQMAIDQQINAIFLDPAAVSAKLKAVIKRNVISGSDND